MSSRSRGFLEAGRPAARNGQPLQLPAARTTVESLAPDHPEDHDLVPGLLAGSHAGWSARPQAAAFLTGAALCAMTMA